MNNNKETSNNTNKTKTFADGMSDADKNEISRTHIVAKKGVDTYDKMSKVGNSSNMNTENTAGESSSTTTMEVRDYYMTP